MAGNVFSESEQALARQLGFLTAQGLDSPSAFERLKQAAPGELKAIVDDLQTLLHTPHAKARYPAMYAEFLRRVYAQDGNPARAVAMLIRLSEDMRVVSDRLFRPLRRKLTYLITVAAMGFLTSWIWMQYVWPLLRSFYGVNRIVEPVVMQSVMDWGFFGFPFAFLLLLIAVFVYAFSARLQRYSIKQLRPWNFMAMSGKLRAAGSTRLAAALCEAFVASGLSLTVALQQTREMAGHSLPARFSRDLEMANDAGTLSEELRHQLARSEEQLERLSVSRGDLQLVLIRFALYALIAAAVISFYQPIFYMGSVGV